MHTGRQKNHVASAALSTDSDPWSPESSLTSLIPFDPSANFLYPQVVRILIKLWFYEGYLVLRDKHLWQI